MKRIIALDETGQFEQRDAGIRLVGGLCGDVEDEVKEGNKISKLLKSACMEFNHKNAERLQNYRVLYPQSLHGGDGIPFYQRKKEEGETQGQKGWEPMSEDISKKQPYSKLRNQFLNFIQNKVLTYIEEQGYQMFAFLDPYMGEEFGVDNAVRSNVVNLKSGANLYERMALLAVYNQIFYSLAPDATEYQLKLATRTLEVGKNISEKDSKALYHIVKKEKQTPEEKQEAKKEKREQNVALEKDTFYSYITNTGTYKTAFSTMLYEKNFGNRYSNVQFVFDVKSINYKYTGEKTPFHYLADIVCGYIRWRLQKKFDVNDKTTENKITAQGLCEFSKETGIQIRIYDDCEVLFRRMINAVKDLDIVEYYASLYELKYSDELYRDFYLDYWIPELQAYLEKFIDINAAYVETFGKRMSEYLIQTEEYMAKKMIAYEKGLFIALQFEALLERKQNILIRGNEWFHLYDIILRGYNHRGSIWETKNYIEKCELYKAYVGAEEYIQHVLRNMQIYFNTFDYESALQVGLRIGDVVKELKRVYRVCYTTAGEISDDIVANTNDVENYQFGLAGKVYSSIGQAYAFKENYGSARRYFLKALDEFDKNSDDYLQTLGYYLHLLISKEKKAEYEIYAATYFQSTDLNQQMENVLQMEKNSYSLFIYVKAFNVFYAGDRSNHSLLLKLAERIKAHANYQAHPWELIYANMYEALLKNSGYLELTQYEGFKDGALLDNPDYEFTIQYIQLGFKAKLIEKYHVSFVSEIEAGEFTKRELETCAYCILDADKKDTMKLCKEIQKQISYMYE